ncbi:MAG: UDP-N-acetylmuramate--L-alanine ligase [Chloroflexota bacterium]
MLREIEMSSTKLIPGMHIHIIGAGGSGMSAIARVLLGRGYVVSGSDLQSNALTAALEEAGATLYIGHEAGTVNGVDLVVVSSAVPADNPEIVAANLQSIPVIKRADLLGELMLGTIGIAVAGSHGKTTTAGMIAHILVEADLDPTVIVGGVLPEIGSNGRYGDGPYFVVEADEYDFMFLGLRPEVSVITNVEHDHPDLFSTEEDYRAAFRQFANLLPDNGRLIVCADDPGAARLLSELELSGVEVTTYGLNGTVTSGPQVGEKVHFRAVDFQPNQAGGTDFVVAQGGQTIGLARLRVPGLHNVRNALAAIVVGLDLQIEFGQICKALATFGGVQRRFQVLGEVGGVTVIDDYAHHPTEIRATLAAARQRYPGRRLWAVWQPHTFSRTRLLAEKFAGSFDDADRVIALDIYRSRESDDLGVATGTVLDMMHHADARYIPQPDEAVAYLLELVRPDDVILTLSAGDGNLVGKNLLEALEKYVGDKGNLGA